MQVSIILSTYNQPAWLELVLWGYASQSYKQFQIVVADDGSATDTRQVVTQMQRWTTLEVEHVWHSHAGFRKCTILNRAVQAASGDYVVFSDGDCIPRRDFVAQHVRLSEPRRFLSGGAIRLPSAVSEAILPEDVVAGRLADVTWLRRRAASIAPRPEAAPAAGAVPVARCHHPDPTDLEWRQFLGLEVRYP